MTPDTPFDFAFAGRVYRAQPGDTIASALARNGVRVISRSFKYHRPRGLLCGAGHCPNCLVQVGDEPNVRACMRPVEPEMVVEPQNAWPSLGFDLMAVVGWLDRFLPVGFYYKAFIRPRALWPWFERFLRRAAGLGRVRSTTPPGDAIKQYLHADVVVIGGGRSGLQAAIAAARAGADVALFDEHPTLGGRLNITGEETAAAARAALLAQAAALPNLRAYTQATVLGWFEDHWLPVMQGNCLLKVRAKAVVVATGAYEQPLLFPNNDLPGIMLAGAVRRLLHQHGVKPGQQAVVVTNNDEGWAVAAELLAAGVTVAALADTRLPDGGSARALPGVSVFWGHTAARGEGRGTLRRVWLAPLTEGGEQGRPTQAIPCDLLVVAAGSTPANGLLYQAGARIAYDEGIGQFVVQDLPPGVFAAGRVTGRMGGDAAAIGRQAAAFALGETPNPAPVVNGAPSLPAPCYRPMPDKAFVCLCEDVTAKDIATAVAEGFDSLELVKRYATVTMGPCQGKMCAAASIHLTAAATGRAIAATGVTTARPPMTPVPLGVLAGPHLEPLRRTPLDEWHRRHGARMLVAGLWHRPEHYGDPTAEVLAVRQAVGLIDVSTLGKLRLTGPGVPAFLDRLYTTRMGDLPVGRVRYGLMANDEGVILDDGVTARLGEQEWYTTTTTGNAEAIYEWLQWWAQAGWGQGVHITDVTEDFAAFNLAGPQARAVLQALTTADLSNEAFPYLHVRQCDIAGVPCRVLRIGFTGELSYEIHCPAGFGLHLWEALLEAGAAFGIRPFGVEAQRVLRLEKAHIIIGQDTDAMSDPLSAGMAWAVKFDKADFLGRRSLVRVNGLGLRQRLVGFEVLTPGVTPEEGLQIVAPNGDGRPAIIGWVTSSRYSPTLGKAIGLCWLPADLAARPGAVFTIHRDAGPVQARVHHGPFYDPTGARLRG